MKLFFLFTLSALGMAATANPCYVSTGSLSGKIGGVKIVEGAQLAIRHYGDGDHVNRMVIKSGKMTVDATYDCLPGQPVECTLSDTPFTLVFDGTKVKIFTRRAKLSVGTYASDEIELSVIPSREDNEIELTSAPVRACHKLLPYSDKIEFNVPQ